MAATADVLKRGTTALVVIDIQERLAAVMARRECVITRTQLLVRAAAIVGAPIIATRQYPKGLGDHSELIGEVLDEAARAGATVLHVDKTSFDCFSEPAFVDAVRSTQCTQLLLAGMETHICVCQTALAGVRSGLEVHVAADACCSREDENHFYATSRIGAAGAVLSTAESAAYELVGRAGTAEFKALLSVVKGETLPVVAGSE